MDIISQLSGMLNFPILVVGFLIGLVVKHLVDDATIQSKWIPVINVAVGAVLGVLLCVTGGAAVTAEAVLMALVGGAVSCVASCGLYDTFAAFVEKGEGVIGADVPAEVVPSTDIDETNSVG